MMKIMNFTADPFYVPAGKDQDVDEPQEGLGNDKNQFPIDRNVTFLFDYMQGTIEQIIFYLSPNRSEYLEVDVAEEGGDIYNVLNFRYSIPFPEVSIFAPDSFAESNFNSNLCDITGGMAEHFCCGQKRPRRDTGGHIDIRDGRPGSRAGAGTRENDQERRGT